MSVPAPPPGREYYSFLQSLGLVYLIHLKLITICAGQVAMKIERKLSAKQSGIFFRYIGLCVFSLEFEEKISEVSFVVSKMKLDFFKAYEMTDD